MKALWKRTHLIAAAAVAVIVAITLTFLNCSAKAPAYKIGAVFTLTGGTAYWSENLQKGMELALEEENRPGEMPIKVLYEDVQGQAQLAASAFQKLSEV